MDSVGTGYRRSRIHTRIGLTAYTVVVAATVAKTIGKLDRDGRGRVIAIIELLANDPRPPNAKRLVGTSAWSARSGDYRVLYTIQDRLLRIDILRAGHRRDVYRSH
jgi:mRNA interferase RelE/StbE